MNATEIQAVVVSHDRPACKPLSLWLSGHRLDWRYSAYDYHVEEVRNQQVRRFLREDVPAGKVYLLLIDDDMVPVESSNAILTAAGDLMYCGTVGPFGTKGHYGDGDFGENFCRLSARLLKRMAYPYFQTAYQDGVRVACDGRHFRQQAQPFVTPKMVGVAGHQQTCIVFPDPDSKLGWQLAWPTDLETRP